jgi:hypothetical protein
VPTAEYQDIKVGPKKLSTFIRFLEGVEPGVRQFDLQIFPVAAARFDYVGDEQEFIQQLSNKMFARFLKSK